MALAVNGARFLARALARGVPLGDLVTVGRLGLYAPKSYLNELLASAGRTERYALAEGDPGYPQTGEWADELYRHCGAKSVRVLDGSAYEGADLVHNLNLPLPAELRDRFDCLIDGGSLEHVFNVPEAVASYMKLVKVGGHVLLLDMPATNGCGHGFYQFSPAFFWQVFSKNHGFEIVEMLAVDAAPYSPFWRVADPAAVQRRVELVHDRPCHCFVLARKIGAFDGFGAMPIQDDYAQSWTKSAAASSAPNGSGPVRGARALLARWAPKAYWRLSNHRNYRRTLGEITLGGDSPRSPYARVTEAESPSDR